MKLLSNCGFKFKLRRFTKVKPAAPPPKKAEEALAAEVAAAAAAEVRRCRLTLSDPL